MILEEKHQKVAIEIVQKNRKKKSCNKCYDRGYIGFSLDKTLIPCEKCVDIDKAMEEWKLYVAGDESLKAAYPELFEEDEKTEESAETAETDSTTAHTHTSPSEPVHHAPVEKKHKREQTSESRPQKKSTTTTTRSMPRKTSRRGNG